MKLARKVRNGVAVAASTVAALALLVMAAPEANAATTTTSAGATVYNKVTVTYASGTVTGLTTSSSVQVTVTTLAAQPTITVDSQTFKILSGTTHLYTYTLKSNSNGTDVYTVTVDGTSKDTNMSTPNADSLNSTAITLWGGYAISSGTDGTGTYITVPGGSTAAAGVNPLAVNAKLNLTVNGTANQTYNVASIAAGRPQTDTQTEQLDKIYLTPVNGSIALSNVAVGTQVGEYKTFTNTVTAGNVNINPANTTITDGTHVTELHVVTAATDLNKAVVTYTTTNGSDVVTTTIMAPILTILKESRNVNANTSFATSGTTARPGEVVEYRITVANLHTDATATITGANVADTLPSYSSYVTGSTTIQYNSGAVTKVTDGAGNTSPLAGSGYTLGTPLNGGDKAYIIYQTTVN
jgi:hypothetical protein